MDKSTENPDEDRVSLRSNGKTMTDGAEKETLGVLQTFRQSIRRVAEKSPLSSGGKGSKVTPKADASGSESGSPLPLSPSEYRHEICYEMRFAGRHRNMASQGQRKRKDKVRFGVCAPAYRPKSHRKLFGTQFLK